MAIYALSQRHDRISANEKPCNIRVIQVWEDGSIEVSLSKTYNTSQHIQ